jgi:hypothetical protein
MLPRFAPTRPPARRKARGRQLHRLVGRLHLVSCSSLASRKRRRDRAGRRGVQEAASCPGPRERLGRTAGSRQPSRQNALMENRHRISEGMIEHLLEPDRAAHRVGSRRSPRTQPGANASERHRLPPAAPCTAAWAVPRPSQSVHQAVGGAGGNAPNPGTIAPFVSNLLGRLLGGRRRQSASAPCCAAGSARRRAKLVRCCEVAVPGLQGTKTHARKLRG